jgi:hypothetical protein
MRISVMSQMARSLRARGKPDLATRAADEPEHLKWFLWHGNVFRALQVVEDLEIDLDVEHPSPEQCKLLKAITEFGGYIRANASSIPNYGEGYRAGEITAGARRATSRLPASSLSTGRLLRPVS